jgi:type IV secretion system protein VirB2
MTLYHQIRAINQTILCLGLFLLVFCLFTPAAHAAGSGMPWEGPLQNILDSVSGPVAQIMGAITIILTGLAYASGEGGAGMRKLIQIVFGLSIAFTASSFFLGFFSFAGGATI